MSPAPRSARLAAAGLVVLLSACAQPAGDTVDVELRLVAADGYVRTEGVECAGTGAYRHVHAGTAFRLEDGDGELLADGELPAGVAYDADPDVEWETERIPTHCVLDLTVPDVPERGAYRLDVGQRRPLEFELEQLESDGPLPLFVE